MKSVHLVEKLHTEKEEEMAIGDLLRIMWVNWYWFVLSVSLCLAAAVVYLKGASFQYLRTGTVLIKTGAGGSGVLSESQAFSDRGVLGIQNNVDNEMQLFQSIHLMTSVVDRLDLDISYTVKKGLRNTELYTQSPVQLRFPDAEPNLRFRLAVMPLDTGKVLLSDFNIASEDIPGQLRVGLNDTVQTPVGRVVVVPTLYYTDQYLDTQINVEKKERDGVVLFFNKALKVSMASKLSTILSLTLQDVSVRRAEDVINTLIAVYNEEAINDKNRIMVNTSEFINERLIIIEKELGSVDSNIEAFKRENRLTDIASEANMYLMESSQYNKEGLELENRLAVVRYIRDYLTDPAKGFDLIPANTGIGSINVEAQIGEYNALLLKRDRLISSSSNRNPVVMDLNKSVQAMKQTIIRSVDNLLVSLDIQSKNIRLREQQTTRRISAVPGQQKQVLSIERQQKIKEELYLYLLNKREENALSQAITNSNARVVDPAGGSNAPVAPVPMLILLSAMLVGCVCPALVIWLRDMSDTKVRNRKDIEERTGIPFLGEIPAYRKRSKCELVVREGNREPISEAFRIIRTNMDFMRVNAKDLKVIMFTSANPGSGKTFISMNMAVSLILAKKRVILVDLDIRKRTLSSYISPSHPSGITNYLSGKETDIDALIVKDGLYEGLDIIQAGPVPPNPTELLLDDKLDKLISELRERYDYVLLDNVPNTMVADAVIVNRVADLTIYVVRAGLFDRRELSERMYKQEKLRNLGIILNGIDYKRAGYSYGYK